MGQPLPVRRLARGAARLLGLPVGAMLMLFLRSSRRRAGVALVYHTLAERTGDREGELVAPHGARLVEEQLRYLARSFRVVDAEELPAAVAGRRRGERFPAAVTFDDDLASHVAIALPVLRRTGLRATFFLTGATLLGPVSFWWERLQRAAGSDVHRLAELFAALGAEPAEAADPGALHALGRLVERLDPAARAAFEAELGPPSDPPDSGLRPGDVRALAEDGMRIGFHTRRHHFLPALDDHALRAAFEEGRSELEEAAEQRLTAVAYPHGTADTRVAEAAGAAGFRIGYTGSPRAVRATDDRLLLGRVEPSHRSAGHFALQLVAALARG
jgi:peptidoglycan/xylan/chitin deacetylase (PgdA/CDA1 family)